LFEVFLIPARHRDRTPETTVSLISLQVTILNFVTYIQNKLTLAAEAVSLKEGTQNYKLFQAIRLLGKL